MYNYYSDRLLELVKLAKEAKTSTADLEQQAKTHADAAQKAARRAEAASNTTTKHQALTEQQGSEQAAAELAQLAAEQQQQGEDIEMRLRKLDAKLVQLRSHRDVLNARLNAARANLKMRVAAPSTFRAKRRLTYAVCVIGVLCLSAIPIYVLWPQRTPQWISLLELVDPIRDTTDALWKVADGVAYFGSHKPRAYVTVPLVVEGSYELHVGVTITRAKETTRLILPVGSNKAVIFDMRGDHGNTESPTATITLSGLDSTPEAKTNRSVKIGREYIFVFKIFVSGQEVTIDVTKDSKLLYSWAGLLSGVVGQPSSIPGTVGLETAYYTTSQFSSLKLQTVSGKGTISKTRPMPIGSMHPDASVVSIVKPFQQAVVHDELTDAKRQCPILLTWPLVQEASKYIVHLRGVRGSRPAITFESVTNSLRLEKVDIAPGRYQWSVSAYDKNGKSFAEIETNEPVRVFAVEDPEPVAQNGKKAVIDLNHTGGHVRGWGIYNYAQYMTKELLENAGFDVEINERDLLTAERLKSFDLLICNYFSTGWPSFRSYSKSELSAVREFVENGGSLLVIGCDRKDGGGLMSKAGNELVKEFGLMFELDKISKQLDLAEPALGQNIISINKPIPMQLPVGVQGENAITLLQFDGLPIVKAKQFDRGKVVVAGVGMSFLDCYLGNFESREPLHLIMFYDFIRYLTGIDWKKNCKEEFVETILSRLQLQEKRALNARHQTTLVVSITDGKLPCGIGRVKRNGTWNEPYRYVFHTYPDYLEGCQFIFMRQTGGGATGRWFETGQIEISKACWLYAAIHNSSERQRQIWNEEGWEILPDILQDLGDPRNKLRPVREYILMRKRLPAGPVNFDTKAQKINMVIWFFKELEL